MSDEFVARLAALNVKFKQNLVSDAETITSLLTAMSRDADIDTLDALQKAAHNLAGSSGIFGFPDLSKQAAVLELSLEKFREKGSRSVEEVCEVAVELLKQMTNVSKELLEDPPITKRIQL